MRQFVVLGHAAAADPDFSLDDLAGGAGRMDVLCRCVNAAFFLSHAIREDVRLQLVLQDRVTIRFEGSELRYVAPDERNIASLIRRALSATAEAVGHAEASATPGIYVSTRGVEAVLDGVDGAVIQLHEEGEPIADEDVPSDPVFVLSDHEDFAGWEEDLLSEHAELRVRLGPERLHADHAITVVHNFLDTEGNERY